MAGPLSSGDVVRVKVLSVDVPRHRISLTLRLDEEGPRPAGGRSRAAGGSPADFSRTSRGSSPRSGASRPGGALADALRRAGLAPEAPETPGDRRQPGPA